MNQLAGRINVSFNVKGTKGRGVMRFETVRVGGAKGMFETRAWTLKMDGDGPEAGKEIDLLVDGDVFRGLAGVQGEGNVDEEMEEVILTKGFRQSNVKK